MTTDAMYPFFLSAPRENAVRYNSPPSTAYILKCAAFLTKWSYFSMIFVCSSGESLSKSPSITETIFLINPPDDSADLPPFSHENEKITPIHKRVSRTRANEIILFSIESPFLYYYYTAIRRRIQQEIPGIKPQMSKN